MLRWFSWMLGRLLECLIGWYRIARRRGKRTSLVRVIDWSFERFRRRKESICHRTRTREEGFRVNRKGAGRTCLRSSTRIDQGWMLSIKMTVQWLGMRCWELIGLRFRLSRFRRYSSRCKCILSSVPWQCKYSKSRWNCRVSGSRFPSSQGRTCGDELDSIGILIYYRARLTMYLSVSI